MIRALVYRTSCDPIEGLGEPIAVGQMQYNVEFEDAVFLLTWMRTSGHTDDWIVSFRDVPEGYDLRLEIYDDYRE